MTVLTMSVFCIGYIQQPPKIFNDSPHDVSILYRIHPATHQIIKRLYLYRILCVLVCCI